MSDDIDTSRLSDDQKKALTLSQIGAAEAAPFKADAAMIGKGADAVGGFLDRHKEGIDTGIKALEYTSPGAAPSYMANQLTGGNHVDSSLDGGGPRVGSSTAAPNQPPPPAAVDPAAPQNQPQAVPAPAQGNIARGMSGGGGGPARDWDKYGAHATGADIPHPELDAARANDQQITGQQGDVATQGAAVQAANLGVRNQGVDQLDANAVAQDAHQQEATDKAQNVYLARSEEAADQKVDHSRFTRNQSTGSKILSQVAVAFGSLGQAFGGHNYAIDNINKHIDDDVKDQESAIDAKKAGAASAKDTYSVLRQSGLDHQAAMAGHRSILLNKAARDAELFAAQQKTPEAQLQGQALVNKLREDAAKNDLEVKQGSRRVGVQARAQMAAAQASANAAQSATAYKHEQDALENRRKDIALGLEAAKIDQGGKDAKGKDLEAAEQKIAATRIDKGIGTGETAVKGMQDLQQANGGDIPGTGLGGRVLGHFAMPNDDGSRGIVSSIAAGLRGSDARQVDSRMYQIAEAQAKASGRSSPELIRENLEKLYGNGSQEDIARNMTAAVQNFNSEKRSQMAANPEAYADFVSKNPDAAIQDTEKKRPPLTYKPAQ